MTMAALEGGEKALPFPFQRPAHEFADSKNCKAVAKSGGALSGG